MKKIKSIIIISFIISFISISAYYIFDKINPHYKFIYNDNTVTITLSHMEKSNHYYVVTTNNIKAFTQEHFCGEQKPNFLINQAVYTLNLKFFKEFSDNNTILYIAEIKDNNVISVKGYKAFILQGNLHNYEPYYSKNIIDEYYQYESNRKELMS